MVANITFIIISLQEKLNLIKKNGLFSLFINLRGLFNTEAILVEEKLWYYSNHC